MKYSNWKIVIRKLRGHDRLVKRTRTALVNQQIPLAARCIEAGRIKFPRSDTFRILQARHLLLTADEPAALEAIAEVDCAAACSIDRLELGDCYRHLGRYATSIDAYRSVLEDGTIKQQRQSASGLVASHLRLHQYGESLDAAIECVRLSGWHQSTTIPQLAELCSHESLAKAIAQLQQISTPDPWHENHRKLMMATFAGSLSQWPLANSFIRQATKAAVAATRPRLKWDDAQPALRPNVIVIGAMKAGSSALFNCLLDHPQFVTPQQKELQFFGDPTLPDDFFFEQFARVAAEQREGLVTGEASPGYYAMPVVSRIRKLLPDVKLIFIKRNPADRAISHVFHNRNVGLQEDSLDMLTKGRDKILELARLSVEDFNAALNRIHSGELHMNRFLLLGCYELFLGSWRAAFSDRLLVLELEDFSNSPQAEMDKVFDFVGIDKHPVTLPKDINAGIYDAHSSALSQMRNQLTEFYQAVDAELANSRS